MTGTDARAPRPLPGALTRTRRPASAPPPAARRRARADRGLTRPRLPLKCMRVTVGMYLSFF